MFVLALASCSRGIETKEAVRQGIIDHLSTQTGLNVNAMQIDVTSLSFRKDEADATVAFRPKGSSGTSAGMTMGYTLERKGNRWVVKGRRDAAGSPHGGGGEMPMAKPADPNSPLPPGHPSTSPNPSGSKQ